MRFKVGNCPRSTMTKIIVQRESSAGVKMAACVSEDFFKK